MNTGVNSGIQVGGSIGDNVVAVAGSQHVNINISNQMQESQADLDTELKKLAEDYHLTKEQMDVLQESLDEFKAYMEAQPSRKSTAKILLDNVKGVFSTIIGNPEAIEKLIGIGQKMINLWK